MVIWDNLCQLLRAREISVEDVSNKVCNLTETHIVNHNRFPCQTSLPCQRDRHVCVEYMNQCCPAMTAHTAHTIMVPPMSSEAVQHVGHAGHMAHIGSFSNHKTAGDTSQLYGKTCMSNTMYVHATQPFSVPGISAITEAWAAQY